MGKTRIHMEGGGEGAPETILLENCRLSAMLLFDGATYRLSSLRTAGDYELLAEASPLLSCFDGAEHLAIPFQRVDAVADDDGGACLRFAAERGSLRLEVTLALACSRPCLEIECRFFSEEDWHGLVYTSYIAHKGFLPTAYPWIAGSLATDSGFVHANCMGAPMIAGDPRGGQGHILAVGFPLVASWRDLFFHYDTAERRVVAGVGEGRSRPGQALPDQPSPSRNSRREGILSSLLHRRQGEAPPAAPPLSLRIPYRAGVTYRLPLQIWALTGQYRTLAGEWVKGNGFSFDMPAVRTPDESLRMTLSFLEHGAPYVAGKGYPMRMHRYTGAPGSGHGGHIHLSGNAALACALYRCWERFRQEWMRERALEIADFILSTQSRDGRIPELFDPRTRKFGSSGAGPHYDGAGLCIDALLRLSLARRQAEERDDVRLRRAAIQFMKELMQERRHRMERERRRGKRRHDQETTFAFSVADITESANVNLLIALERLRQLTGEYSYESVREDAEKWLLRNVYAEMSWRGGDPIHQGLETGSLLRFLEYCILRFDITRASRYLEIAESLASYLFLTLVPKNLEWCAGHTKGLCIANADWRALVPSYTGMSAPVAALRRLGKLCNDRFFAQLGDYLVQAALPAQCDEKGVPGYGGWLPALNSPDGNAFPLNSAPDGGEVCITEITPAVLETYLYLTA